MREYLAGVGVFLWLAVLLFAPAWACTDADEETGTVPGETGLSPAFKDTKRIVSPHKAVFTEPPRKIPSDTAVDAPLLGNGDMGVAFGGPPEAPRFWLAKNDFWRLKSQYGESQPRLFGGVDLAIPGLAGAGYHVEQHLYDAMTVGIFIKNGSAVTMRSWVAATENVLVVELSAQGAAFDVEVALWAAEGDGAQQSSGRGGDVPWVAQEYLKDVDIPTGAACALSIVGQDEQAFKLEPGRTVTVVAALRSRLKSGTFLDDCRKRVASMDAVGVEVLRAAHVGWWSTFWSQSFVELDDPDIERHYYLSNYILGSCSRDPEFPPGIFGTWNTVVKPAWEGDYHLNYNHMAPYYGLYSSNHIEQADPYHAPILDFMDRGRWYARNVVDCRGVMYPVGIGPKGIETTRNSPHKKNTEKEGLFWGQKSNTAYAVVNLSMRWYRTYDLTYAKTVYPFVREVADFWEDFLRFEDGRYVIRGDAIHEGSGANINPILSLGLVPNVMETAIDMSSALGIDADRHPKWRHILDHMSEFVTQKRDGKTVFRYTEKGTDWWGDNTLGIQHIYPSGRIGLDSDPELLRVARNTIDVMNRWIDNNGMNSFLPAAVRVGYDPKAIFDHLGDYVRNHANTNGFAAHNPHGIENCSIVPNTINEMMCMGHQGVLRFFPVWPKDRPARFGSLRAEGAFLCWGAFAEGRVQYARIMSERGRECIVVNPWAGKRVTLYRDGSKAESLEGERLLLATRAGESIELCPEGADMEAMRVVGARPLMSSQTQ
jgi:glycosyl hydrolase family 95